MAKTLYEKVIDAHRVQELPSGKQQIVIGLHLIHEVTSPQAFAMLKERGVKVAHPERTFATVDHIIPTHNQNRPLEDELAEEMFVALEKNTREYGIHFFSPDSGGQGIVHIIGPETGLTQPGMTICCGDSHTSTHGAFGALAFGIGTSQVRDVLATQTMAVPRLKVRRIEVNGKLQPGVFAKDVILYIIRLLGVKGGIGYAYEYAGEVFDHFSMEERMTVCNMSIEGGAQCGYVNPDQTTYDYLKGREYAPAGPKWDEAVAWWDSLRSDPDAEYDDIVKIDAADIRPVVTWGITPGQSVFVDEKVPDPDDFSASARVAIEEALFHMNLEPGEPVEGLPIDVAFLGSCTNGRFSDFETVVKLLRQKGGSVASGVRALVAPGSQRVRQQLIDVGYDQVFEDAGFEFREAGCSMCLAMNPDKLEGRQISASSSNRNFKGRQGSPTGRTLLMSPAMVLAAALNGKVTDVRKFFKFD
ncbi:MAG: 3-isopropylmalate dehydratase large subunit [Candidatus Sumerlaeia bacterium]